MIWLDILELPSAILSRPSKKHVGQKQKNHDGLSASKMSSFRVKFSLLIAEFSGDLCKQDCSLNGIAFIQIAPTFLMLSEFTPCPNPPQSTIYCFYNLRK